MSDASTGRRVVQVVCSDAFAGVEAQVADVSAELARRGWDVTVVGGDEAAMRARLPMSVRLVPGASVPAAARALWSLGRCDIVHAHMTAGELAAVVLRRRLGGPVLVTRHFATARGRTWGGRLARRYVARRVDGRLAISDFVARTIGEPSQVLRNGVRPTSGAPGPRRPTVLVLQRLEQEKDTATALRAFAESGLAADGWRLVVHGRGSQDEQLRDLVAHLGADCAIDLAGFTDDPRGALAASAILLATARAEPFGLSVLEAMAEGTPVLAADGGAHRETLGADGRFFPVGDVAACAVELAALAADAGTRADIGARLQTRFTDGFTLDQHVDALERIYRAHGAGSPR